MEISFSHGLVFTCQYCTQALEYVKHDKDPVVSTLVGTLGVKVKSQNNPAPMIRSGTQLPASCEHLYYNADARQAGQHFAICCKHSQTLDASNDASPTVVAINVPVTAPCQAGEARVVVAFFLSASCLLRVAIRSETDGKYISGAQLTFSADSPPVVDAQPPLSEDDADEELCKSVRLRTHSHRDYGMVYLSVRRGSAWKPGQRLAYKVGKYVRGLDGVSEADILRKAIRAVKQQDERVVTEMMASLGAKFL